MRYTLAVISVFFQLSICAQNLTERYPETVQVVITNPLESDREQVVLSVPVETMIKVAPGFNQLNFLVFDGKAEIPSELANTAKGGNEIILSIGKVRANEKKTLSIRYARTGTSAKNYPKRTQAELSHKTGGEWKGPEYVGGKFLNVNFLRVPKEHKSHSWYIRYEGPGWESDKVAYRLYLDERNAHDVFGKIIPEPVLQKVGQNNFESYHDLQPWGMDILKVGNSLGLGSIGTWREGKATRVEITDSITCEITNNGSLHSSFITRYYGWNSRGQKQHLTTETSIQAGSRLTHLNLHSTAPMDFCTGIIKDKNAQVQTFPGDDKSFGFMATYGKQSLNNDELGLVVFFRPSTLASFAEDVDSHVVVFKPGQKSVEYYFAAAWIREPGGLTNKNEFMAYVKKVATELANPVKVDLNLK
jgi:hypothetical protein